MATIIDGDGALKAALGELNRVTQEGGDLTSVLRDLASALEFLRDIPPPTAHEIYSRLASLPFDAREAVIQMGLTRLINHRVQSGYYRDRLIVLATQEKSSSTLHEVVINEMLSHSGGIQVVVPSPRPLVAGPTTMGGGAAFHFGMLLFFPNGGVCRGVFEPNRQNRWLVNELGSRRIVLTRHPADRIVAQYCMRSGELADSTQATNGETSVFQSIFRGLHLPITVDSLRHNLRWLAGWQHETSSDRVLIIRYEDMMANVAAHFERIHHFIYATPMSEFLSAAIQKHVANSGEAGSLQSGDVHGRVYPKGYSGKVGVWRDYLSTNDIAAYNEVTERFLRYDEDGPQLLALYPDAVLRSKREEPA